MADVLARRQLEAALPALGQGSYVVTSPKTVQYNCIAWAAGDDQHWWQSPTPMNIGGYHFYWPPGLPPDDSVQNYVKAFESRGYSICVGGELEAGIEKIVLYAYPGERGCSHAARQLPNGRWASKCGGLHDIEHATPHDIAGPRGHGYGDVAQYMSRPLAPSS